MGLGNSALLHPDYADLIDIPAAVSPSGASETDPNGPRKKRRKTRKKESSTDTAPGLPMIRRHVVDKGPVYELPTSERPFKLKRYAES